MAASTQNTGGKSETSKPAKAKELKTDSPLSEKDEVKKAERKTNKSLNKKP